MISVRQPTDDERQELRRLMRQAVGRVSQRAHMVLLSAAGPTVPALAELFGWRRASVRFGIRRFHADGPPGLCDAPRSGWPRKVTAAVEATTDRLIRQDPQDAGYPATFGTVAMLVLALASQLHVRLSPRAVRALLHRLDLRCGRPRRALLRKVDPDKARKQWEIVKTVVEAGPEAPIRSADESRSELLPLVRRIWHWVGQQVRMPTPGTTDTRARFGVLNIRTGDWT